MNDEAICEWCGEDEGVILRFITEDYYALCKVCYENLEDEDE